MPDWRSIQIRSRWPVNRGYVDTRYTCWSVCLGWVFSGSQREAKCFWIWTGRECLRFQLLLKLFLSISPLLTDETYLRNMWRSLLHSRGWPQMFHFTKSVKETSHVSSLHISHGILQKQVYVTDAPTSLELAHSVWFEWELIFSFPLCLCIYMKLLMWTNSLCLVLKQSHGNSFQKKIVQIFGVGHEVNLQFVQYFFI